MIISFLQIRKTTSNLDLNGRFNCHNLKTASENALSFNNSRQKMVSQSVQRLFPPFYVPKSEANDLFSVSGTYPGFQRGGVN